jgi:predicted patatin/cPLA2 family phospholipase
MNDINNQLWNACDEGDFNYAKNIIINNSSTITTSAYEKAFIYACCHGELNFAQWLKNTIDFTINYEVAFNCACRYKHFDFAQCLLKNEPTIDMSALYDKTFIFGCLHYQLDIIMWLQSLMPFRYFTEEINDDVKPIILSNKEFNTLTLICMLNKTGFKQNINCNLFNAK